MRDSIAVGRGLEKDSRFRTIVEAAQKKTQPQGVIGGRQKKWLTKRVGFSGGENEY